MPVNVLIQTAFLGDLLLSIPLLRRIKALWPDQALVLVCRKGVGEFFQLTGLADEIIEVKKGDPSSYDKAFKILQQKEVARVFSAHGSVRTAKFVGKLKAAEKVGFRAWWNGLFYNHRIKKDMRWPDAVRQLSLLQDFDPRLKSLLSEFSGSTDLRGKSADGRLSPPPTWASMSLKDYYERASSTVEQTLLKLGLSSGQTKLSVALFPGSVWATKRWTEEGFVKLGQILAAENVQVLVMGGPGEEALCEAVTRQIPRATNLCGKTSIFESALVLSRVAAVVGNDSASLHLAATAETPSVVVFGPTVLEFGFRPWQKNVFVSEIEGMACRPCGKHGHQKCPLGHHNCMKKISAEEVRTRLQFALSQR